MPTLSTSSELTWWKFPDRKTGKLILKSDREFNELIETKKRCIISLDSGYEPSSKRLKVNGTQLNYNPFEILSNISSDCLYLKECCVEISPVLKLSEISSSGSKKGKTSTSLSYPRKSTILNFKGNHVKPCSVKLDRFSTVHNPTFAANKFHVNGSLYNLVQKDEKCFWVFKVCHVKINRLPEIKLRNVANVAVPKFILNRRNVNKFKDKPQRTENRSDYANVGGKENKLQKIVGNVLPKLILKRCNVNKFQNYTQGMQNRTNCVDMTDKDCKSKKFEARQPLGSFRVGVLEAYLIPVKIALEKCDAEVPNALQTFSNTITGNKNSNICVFKLPHVSAGNSKNSLVGCSNEHEFPLALNVGKRLIPVQKNNYNKLNTIVHSSHSSKNSFSSSDLKLKNQNLPINSKSQTKHHNFRKNEHIKDKTDLKKQTKSQKSERNNQSSTCSHKLNKGSVIPFKMNLRGKCNKEDQECLPVHSNSISKLKSKTIYLSKNSDLTSDTIEKNRNQNNLLIKNGLLSSQSVKNAKQPVNHSIPTKEKNFNQFIKNKSRKPKALIKRKKNKSPLYDPHKDVLLVPESSSNICIKSRNLRSTKFKSAPVAKQKKVTRQNNKDVVQHNHNSSIISPNQKIKENKSIVKSSNDDLSCRKMSGTISKLRIPIKSKKQIFSLKTALTRSKIRRVMDNYNKAVKLNQSDFEECLLNFFNQDPYAYKTKSESLNSTNSDDSKKQSLKYKENNKNHPLLRSTETDSKTVKNVSYRKEISFESKQGTLKRFKDSTIQKVTSDLEDLKPWTTHNKELISSHRSLGGNQVFNRPKMVECESVSVNLKGRLRVLNKPSKSDVKLIKRKGLVSSKSETKRSSCNLCVQAIRNDSSKHSNNIDFKIITPKNRETSNNSSSFNCRSVFPNKNLRSKSTKYTDILESSQTNTTIMKKSNRKLAKEPIYSPSSVKNSNKKLHCFSDKKKKSSASEISISSDEPQCSVKIQVPTTNQLQTSMVPLIVRVQKLNLFEVLPQSVTNENKSENINCSVNRIFSKVLIETQVVSEEYNLGNLPNVTDNLNCNRSNANSLNLSGCSPELTKSMISTSISNTIPKRLNTAITNVSAINLNNEIISTQCSQENSKFGSNKNIEMTLNDIYKISRAHSQATTSQFDISSFIYKNDFLTHDMSHSSNKNLTNVNDNSIHETGNSSANSGSEICASGNELTNEIVLSNISPLYNSNPLLNLSALQILKENNSSDLNTSIILHNENRKSPNKNRALIEAWLQWTELNKHKLTF